MQTTWLHSKAFRTTLWCVIGYAVVFVVANFDVLTGDRTATAHTPHTSMSSYMEDYTDFSDQEALFDEHYFDSFEAQRGMALDSHSSHNFYDVNALSPRIEAGMDI